MLAGLDAHFQEQGIHGGPGKLIPSLAHQLGDGREKGVRLLFFGLGSGIRPSLLLHDG